MTVPPRDERKRREKELRRLRAVMEGQSRQCFELNGRVFDLDAQIRALKCNYDHELSIMQKAIRDRGQTARQIRELEDQS